jgi:bacteriocin biosynthesis cyclodehydratase domain-containing protein
MALQIDPRFPVLWRTPTSVQIGADRPIVTLSEVTVPEEYLLAVLRKGISRPGLDMIGQSVGATPDSVADLLVRVGPSLRSGPAKAARLEGQRVSVTGSRHASEAIRGVLEGLGARLVDDTDRPELAIIVSTFDTDPRQAGAWLRRDIPHLAVVFGDAEVRVGPLVEPGAGPCLHCVERARIDDDEAWPALAGQLLGRSAPTEDPLTVSTTTPVVARIVLDRLGDGVPAARRYRLRSRALVIDGLSGDITERCFRPHPDCACREVPPAETAMADAAASAPYPTLSTTALDGSVPG